MTDAWKPLAAVLALTMSIFFLGLVVATLSKGASQPSSSAELAFPMSFEQFRSALDDVLRKDSTGNPNDNTTKSCQQESWGWRCSFNDEGFQRSVAALTDLRLVRGQFHLNLDMYVTPVKGGLSGVRIDGARRDPSNLYLFIAVVAAAGKALTGKPYSSDPTALIKDLDLMGGDNDPHIDQPKKGRWDEALLKCLKYPTAKSFAVSCTFFAPGLINQGL